MTQTATRPQTYQANAQIDKLLRGTLEGALAGLAKRKTVAYTAILPGRPLPLSTTSGSVCFYLRTPSAEETESEDVLHPDYRIVEVIDEGSEEEVIELDSIDPSLGSASGEPVQLPALHHTQQVVEPFPQGILDPYECKNKEGVRAFLQDHAELASLLEETLEKAREFFDHKVRVRLEVVHDGEYFVTPELFVRVLTSLPQEAAWKAFLAMQDEWWVHRAPAESVNLDVRLM